MANDEKQPIKREADYEWAEKKAYFKNLELFLKNPFDNDSLKKMQSYSKKHFIPLEAIITKVKEDEIFARNFVKDPIRQSVHENEAARFITQNKQVLNFKKLPMSGANSIFLHEGRIITKKEKDEFNLRGIKSIDFYWEIESKEGKMLKFYSSHKYTNEEGGGQDHQYTEQIKFLESASNSNMGNDVYFVAICDGDYYNTPNKKDHKTRLEIMKELDISNQSIALTLSEFDDYISSISTQLVKKKRKISKPSSNQAYKLINSL